MLTPTQSPLSTEISFRFTTLAKTLSIPPLLAHSTSQFIANAYSEPQRHYHTLTHIQDMFSRLDEIRLGVENREAVELAIFFHDVVYDPVRGAPWNEEESLRAWEEFIYSARPHLVNSFRILDHLRTPVSSLILATISHKIPSSLPPSLSVTDLKIFLDLDLFVLASPPTVYQQYASNIRREYKHVPAEAYREGRAQVLRKFLERERLFFGEGIEEMERVARKNLRGELKRLEEEGGV
ncbi:hypothetical protein P7C70_g2084, partial [Phenoliferia sp. Uapishka_3]